MNIPHSYQLFTAEGSRSLDERTINEFGIDGFTLMEIAGTRAADFIQHQIESDSHGLFICGKGNNAGDALVVARILSENGYTCSLLFVSGTDSLSPDCNKNLELFRSLNTNNIIYASFSGLPEQTHFDFIVDGMLGTGLNSNIREPYSTVIDWINKQKALVFSMDIPTGLNADTGEIMGSAVIADFTLAFGTLKQGFYFSSGYELCGEIIFCELPFPSKYKNSRHFLIDRDWVELNRKKAHQRAHKYDGGVVYILAGSSGLTGAAILASQSAWAVGVGAVVLITPKGLLSIYEKNLPQIIKKTIGSEQSNCFAADQLDAVLNIINEKPGVVLIGPGLGRAKETVEFVRSFLSRYEGNVVIDADACFAMNEGKLLSKPETASWLITPHPGEFSKLSVTTFTTDSIRLSTTQEFSTENNIITLSKGLPSIISTSDGNSMITGYDTRIFSRAGFGDVLAGKTTAFWLIEKKGELAGCLALLDGKEKADNHILSSENTLEPLDII